MYVLQSDYENVLGTFLSLRLVAAHQEAAAEIEEALLQTLDRLALIFHPFVLESEVNCWQRGELQYPSTELAEMIDWAQHLHTQTNGAFHVGVAEFTQLWKKAEQTGCLPDAGSIAEIQSRLAEPLTLQSPPPYRIELSALAKGYIAQQVAQTAINEGASSVRLNIGGEIVQLGNGACIAEITHPVQESLVATRITLRQSALASSGHLKKGYRVAGKWYSHIIDPRTGWPVSKTSGASVISDHCFYADAWATALSVLDPLEGLDLCEQASVAAVIFSGSGEMITSSSWPSRQTSFSRFLSYFSRSFL